MFFLYGRYGQGSIALELIVILILFRGDRRSRVMDVNVAPNLNIPILSVSQASIAETNWKFVNQLLKVRAAN